MCFQFCAQILSGILNWVMHATSCFLNYTLYGENDTSYKTFQFYYNCVVTAHFTLIFKLDWKLNSNIHYSRWKSNFQVGKVKLYMLLQKSVLGCTISKSAYALRKDCIQSTNQNAIFLARISWFPIWTGLHTNCFVIGMFGMLQSK